MSKLTELQSRLPTHVYSTRVDIRYLATLIMFWHSRGELPRSISELNRLSLETFVELLIQNDKTEFIELLSDAEDILDKTGFKARPLPKNIVQEMVKENFSLDTSTQPLDQMHQTTKLAQTLDQNLKADLEQRIKEEQERTKHLDNLGTNPITHSDLSTDSNLEGTE